MYKVKQESEWLWKRINRSVMKSGKSIDYMSSDGKNLKLDFYTLFVKVG